MGKAKFTGGEPSVASQVAASYKAPAGSGMPPAAAAIGVKKTIPTPPKGPKTK